MQTACKLIPRKLGLPSFGGAGGGYWGGRTTYLYLVKIKIHLMIHSLVCVPSPFLDIHPESLTPKAHQTPLPKPTPDPSQGRGEGSLSPSPSPKREGSNMQIDLANTLVHKVYSIHNDIIYHCP